MSVELTVLGLSVLLAVVQLLLFAVPANLEIGSHWLAGPRDDTMKPLSVRTARLQRAFINHIEGLVLFTAAVVVVVMGGASSATTETAATAYLVARIAYVPCYWTGVRWVRSVVWGVAIVSTVVMVVAALLAPGPA